MNACSRCGDTGRVLADGGPCWCDAQSRHDADCAVTVGSSYECSCGADGAEWESRAQNRRLALASRAPEAVSEEREKIAEIIASAIMASPDVHLHWTREEAKKRRGYDYADRIQSLRAPAPSPAEAKCPDCGAPATCFGTYDGITGYGCDNCCGHGNEDGHCEPLPAPASPVWDEKEYERLRDKLTWAHQLWGRQQITLPEIADAERALDTYVLAHVRREP